MRPRFTLQLTLKDNQSYEVLEMAIPVDEAVRISAREVEELKEGAELGLMPMDHAFALLRKREFRKLLFIDLARRLGALLAERMEDAEGWHDVARVEPARKALGGTWK